MSDNFDVDQLLVQLTDQIASYLKAKSIVDPVMVGIHTGGVWIASALHKNLAINAPLGTLDISFYRDDFTQVGLNPKVKPSTIPFSTENAHVILVDDVVMSGRTVRAALNELFDYGRPASVTLVSLIDLNAQQLPVRPDVTALSLTLEPGQRIKLTGPEPLALEVRPAVID